jgi:hypothetical protein
MPNIICVPHHANRTKDVAAKELGVKVYDTALPEPWLDHAAETIAGEDLSKTREGVYGMLLTSTVWSYDHAKIFGAPHPLTVEAWGLLKALDRYSDTHCVDEIGYTHNVLLIGD